MNRRSKTGKFLRSLTLGLLLISMVLVFCPVAEACPTCKDALHTEHEGVAKGYYWSILFLMGMPFAIFAGWGIYIYRAVRRMQSDPAYSDPLLADPAI